MMAGSLAGMIATCVSHPLDTVKVRFQLSQTGDLTLRSVVTEIYRYEGVSQAFLHSTVANNDSYYIVSWLFQRCIKSDDRTHSNHSNVSINNIEVYGWKFTISF